MKRNNKKTLTKILSFGLVFCNILPAFAYDIPLDKNDNSEEFVEYQNSSDDDFVSSTNVFAKIASEYKITIPKTIVLNGTKKEAGYNVKVEGDIAGYETIYVVPEDSFDLYTTKKFPQLATVTQDKVTWKYNEFDTVADGLVQAPTITAGKWSGVFYFNIGIEGSDDDDFVLGDIILPDGPLYDDYKLVINKIKDKPGLYNDEGICILPWPDLEEEVAGGTPMPEVINGTPGGIYLSIPEGTTYIPKGWIEDTKIQIIYIPPTVKEIEPGFANGTEIEIICVGPSTHVTPETFSGTPAGETGEIYIGGKPMGPDIYIDIETLPESPEDIKDEDAIILEKGCTYNVTALYNFINDVTKQSTIKSSNPSVVKFTPDSILDALEIGTSIISGKYNSPTGLKDAYILVKVVNTGYTKEETTTGHKHVVGPLQTENVVERTCTENGSYDQVFYCTDCGKELGRRTITTKAPGHNNINGKCTNCGHNSITYSSNIPGLYDSETDEIIMTWQELLDLGLDIEKDYSVQAYWREANFSGYTNGTGIFYDNNLSGKLIIGNVSRIGSNTFYKCEKITAVKIPDSITEISYDAFCYAHNLKEVVLSKNLKTIETSAFDGCSITNLTIPAKVTLINQAFIGNPLTSVVFENKSNWVRATDRNGSDKVSISVNDAATNAKGLSSEKWQYETNYGTTFSNAHNTWIRTK